MDGYFSQHSIFFGCCYHNLGLAFNHFYHVFSGLPVLIVLVASCTIWSYFLMIVNQIFDSLLLFKFVHSANNFRLDYMEPKFLQKLHIKYKHLL